MATKPQSKRSNAPADGGAPPADRAWRLTAWIGGSFSVLVGLGLLVGFMSVQLDDPLRSLELKQYKEKLRANPADEPTKQQIRQLDLDLRQKYFHHLSQARSGFYLLAGGLVVFVLAIGRVNGLHRKSPTPEGRPDLAGEAARAAARARWSVAATGAAVGALLLVLSIGLSTPSAKGTAGAVGSPSPTHSGDGAGEVVSLNELKQNWPRFLGAAGSGQALATNPPSHWDVKSGVGLMWKVAAPVIGFGSPIVWGNRVFLAGGDAARREVVCLEAKSGAILWRQAVANVAGSPAKVPEVPESTGYAAATPATDGRRVYAIFANGDLAAITLEGKPVWSKSFGTLKNPYGHAASLATWQNRLIVQLDQGESDEGKSRLYALDGGSGQVVWQAPRKVASSWASPLVIEAAGRAQIIALAVPWVTAYAAADGAELWRVDCLNGEVLPSPCFAGGLLFVASPAEKLAAIGPDGHGDVTKSNIVWSTEDNVPDISSPVSNGELVFTLTTGGLLTAWDARDGKKQWDHDFETEFHASPGLAGNWLYLFGVKGTAIVVEAGRQFKEVFRTEMGDVFQASPAFAQDQIFLRGVTNVWSLGGAHGP
jgi:outer membrane protein assembly factor BamB